MPLYADLPARRTRQITVDVAVVVTIAVAVAVALAVRDLVLTLRAPGEQLVEAGSGLQGSFDGAAESAGRIPVFGEALADGLGRGGGAGETLVSAGQSHVAAVEAVAAWLAVLIVAVPVLLALVGWLPWRVHYARRSGAVRRLAGTGQHDLLALRALTRMSPERLVTECRGITEDPAGAWRRGDPAVVQVLAAAELRSHGLTPAAPVG